MTQNASIRSILFAAKMAALVGLGFWFLAMAYVVGNPQFHANDELFHYYRAIGISQGDLIGEETEYDKPGYPADKLAQVRRLVRAVEVPPGMTPQRGVGCTAFSPEIPATCTDDIVSVPEATVRPTILGVYAPAPYFASAAAMTLADDATEGLFYGRAANAAVGAVWMAVAAFVSLVRTRKRDVWLFVALLITATPTVVFVFGSLSASGLEFGAGLVFIVATLRLISETQQDWVLATLASVSAFVFLISRASTPLWFFATIAVAAIAYLTTSGARSRWKYLKALGAAAAAGLVLNRLWEALYGPDLIVTMDNLGSAIVRSASLLGEVLAQAVGVLGWLDARMPTAAYVIWVGLGLLLVAWALLTGTPRERLALTLVAVAAAVVPALLDAVLIRGTGFGVQGRHVFMLFVLPVLLAGNVLHRADRTKITISYRTVLVSIAGTTMTIQALAFLSNARRHAVGSEGPIVFLGHSQWTPPGGWAAPLVLLTLGIATILLVVAVLYREGFSTGEPLSEERLTAATPA